MNIRKATLQDIPDIMQAIKHGRHIQKQNNNLNQWSDDYPNEMTIIDDIEHKQSYVIEADNTTVGTFCLMNQPDPTYKVIDGAWLNDAPYATIHRLATTGAKKGVADAAFNYAKSLYDNIRVDTHADNLIMQHVIKKHGFSYCGIIQTEDGSDRLAYQWA